MNVFVFHRDLGLLTDIQTPQSVVGLLFVYSTQQRYK